MLKTILSKRFLRVAAAVVAACVLAPAIAQARKPGGGGGGVDDGANIPATIYFVFNNGGFETDAIVIGMNSDGSSKFQALPSFGDIRANSIDGSEWVEPSVLEYGTLPSGAPDRWFIYFSEVGYVPGVGAPIRELFAANGAGDIVQLTDVTANTDMLPGGYPRWSNDGFDSFISFTSDDADGAHLWILNVTVADFTSPDWVPVVPGDDRLQQVFSVPNGGSHHDWSPDGAEVVYTDGSLVVVRTLATGGDRVLADNVGFSGAPRWSPDGTRIAFGDNHSIWTINIDGSGATEVLAYHTRTIYQRPIWSPTVPTTHLVVSWRKWLNSPEVARVRDDGTSLSVLTEDLGSRVELYPVGWRPNVSAADVFGP